jgi:hypothetical protein
MINSEKRGEKFVAALRQVSIRGSILRFLRKRHRLKVALVRSWSATGGVRRLESELRHFAQDPSQRRLELPPLVVRSSDGRSRGIVSAGRSLVFEASSRYVREVPEAHLLPPDIILSQDRRFVTENLNGEEAAALKHGVLGAFVRSFSPVEHRLGAVFSLLGPSSHNYFHWLTQYLPRVEDFLLWRTVAAPNAKLLLAPGLWQIRLLELLGVSRDLSVSYSLRHSTAEVAAAASYPGYPGNLALPATPERLTWVRSRILTALELKEQPRTRRLFISRRDSGAHRPIKNEEEIARTLERRGFQTVALGNLEIDDQVRLFAAARVVVAAHGAGLANLVFSTAPTVIELFPPDWVQPDFQAFQRALAYQALTLFTGGRHVGVSLQGSLQSGLRADVGGLLRVLAEELGEGIA